MTRLYRLPLLLLALSSAALAAAPATPGNPALGQRIFMNGINQVPACHNCHGKDAMGDDALGTPRLAGQAAAYLLKQLGDFAANRRMDKTMYVMNTNARGMREQDWRNLAAYLSGLEYRRVGLSKLEQVKEYGETMGVRQRGRQLFLHGDPAREIPPCYTCHGYNGRGLPPTYPMTGGQRFVYLINQLHKWRAGSRSNDPDGVMRGVAKNLTHTDIRDVATFLTSAPRGRCAESCRQFLCCVW